MGIVVASILLRLHHGAGGGVDFVVVLHASGAELDFIAGHAVVIIQFNGQGLGGAFVDLGVVQSGVGGSGFTNVGGGVPGASGVARIACGCVAGTGIAARGRSAGVPGVVAGLLLILHHAAIQSVDVVFVLGSVAAEIQFIHHNSLGPAKFRAQALNVGGGDLGVVTGGLQSGILPNIGLVTGGAGLRHPGGGQVAGRGDQGNFTHGEGGQGVKGEGAVLGDDFLDKAGLSGGNVVLLGQLGQFVADGDILGENGAGLEGAGDGGGQLALQLCGFCGIRIFHRDQNGILQFVQVSLLQTGADEGVDGGFQVGALQFHATHDLFGVIVEGGGLQHGLLGVNGQGDAGVDVQGHHGVGGAGLLEAGDTENAACYDGQGGNGGQGGQPAVFLLVGHSNHSSFLFLAGGKDGIQLIGDGMVRCLFDALVNLFVGHLSLPPSMRC